MPKHFTTKKRYLTYEEKLKQKIEDYQCNEFGYDFEIVYIYPEGYREITKEESELLDQIIEAEIDGKHKKAEKLRALLPPPGPDPYMDVYKTLENIPELDRTHIINYAKINEIFEETIILKCYNCDYEEEVDYWIVAECWMDGPYPISYCPHCNKPKFIPIDVYNKKKSKVS